MPGTHRPNQECMGFLVVIVEAEDAPRYNSSLILPPLKYQTMKLVFDLVNFSVASMQTIFMTNI